MNAKHLTNLWNTTRTMVSKRSPEILTGLGIAGMVTTTILAVKATPKALRLIEEEKRKQLPKDWDPKHDPDVGHELTPVETVKVAWKPYIPAAVTGVASIACLIGAQSVNARRKAALATAYQLSATALAEYKEKVTETIGEKKENVIQEKIAKDKLEKKKETNSNLIIAGDAKMKCYDGIYGQEFDSSALEIEKALNRLNYQMLSSQYVSLNDLYDELGIEHIAVGDEVGWNISKHGLVDVNYSSRLNKDNVACLVFEYNIPPDRNYQSCY